MRKRIAALALLISWGLFGDAGDAAQVAPDGFAGRLSLSAKPGEPAFLEIPECVYVHAQTGDLRDLCVFDAQGLPVPFLLLAPEQVSETPEPLAVPFFLWTPVSGTAPEKTDIEIDASGAVLRVKGSVSSSAALQNTKTYLVDLSAVTEDAASLVFDFSGAEAFNTACTVEYSDDLSRWQSFGTRETLARYGNDRINRLSHAVPPKARYVLVHFEGEAPALHTVTVHFKSVARFQKTYESRFAGVKSSDSRSVLFTGIGALPLVSVNFALEQADALPVDISIRHDPEGPWLRITAGMIFRYRTNGVMTQNDPFPVSSRAPEWRLDAKGYVFTSAPDMVVSWAPNGLVFLARGDGPWALAYGNAVYRMPETSALHFTESVSLLPRAVVIGEETYAPPVLHAEGERTWLLWAVLIAAAALLTGMAVVVRKQLP
jgi:hypothetical protein